MQTRLVKLFLGLMLVCAAGCTAYEPHEQAESVTVVVATVPAEDVAYCEARGYFAEQRQRPNGEDSTVCVFPNRSECDTRDFYADRCGPTVDPFMVPRRVERVRDEAMHYVGDRFDMMMPHPDAPWHVEWIASGQVAGEGGYRFSAESCIISVDYLAINDPASGYAVTVRDDAQRIFWTGQYDSNGQRTMRRTMPNSETYTNLEHGFQFSYPLNWQLSDAPNVIRLRQGHTQLRIAYKWVDEIAPTVTVPELFPGEWHVGDSTPFFGREVAAYHFFFNDNMKAIYFDKGTVVVDDLLVFHITLENFSNPAHRHAYLSQSEIADTEAILASFSWIEIAARQSNVQQ